MENDGATLLIVSNWCNRARPTGSRRSTGRSGYRKRTDFSSLRQCRADSGLFAVIRSIWIPCLLIWSAGCTGTSDVVRPDLYHGVIGDTLASSIEIVHNLSRLNADVMEGRATATRGLARAAVYLSERLEGYGIQPAISPRYRQLYPMVSRELESLSLVALGADTVRYQPGSDFYLHNQSGSGSERVSELILDPSERDELDSRAIFLSHTPSTETLDNIRSRGARAIVINANPFPSPLNTGPTNPEWAHIPIVMMPFETLERLGIVLTHPGPEGRLRDYSLDLTVEVGTPVVSSGINVLGILPGMHPTGRKRAIVLAARFDGYGRMGQVVKTDGTDRLTGAATLMETARLLSAFRARGAVLDETVIFLFVSGSMNANAGLEYFLDHPVWSSSSIDQIMYLNDVGEDSGGVEQLLGQSTYSTMILSEDGTQNDYPSGIFSSPSEFYDDLVFQNDAATISSRAASLVRQIKTMSRTRW